MKIYDCFTFNNEIDLLEIRLNVLNDKVDYFVIVEATRTHSGESKDLFFQKNKLRFKEFMNKIIHVVVEDMPELKNGNRWGPENFQRNAIMRGLSDCSMNDLILISDLDEIPNLRDIDSIKSILEKAQADIMFSVYLKTKYLFVSLSDKKIIKRIFNHFLNKSNKVVIFKQKLFYYYLNGFLGDQWLGTRAVLYKDLIGIFNRSPQLIRESLSKNIINFGGWHFSYIFKPEDISKKISSFAHSEFDKPEFTDIKLIEEKIKNREGLFGGTIKYEKIDNLLPEYIVKNRQKYSSLIKDI